MSEVKYLFNVILFNILKNAVQLNSSENIGMQEGFINDVQSIQENTICSTTKSKTSTPSSSASWGF